MKRFFKFILLTFAGLVSVLGLSKRDKNNAEQDAIRLPEINEISVVEDYELAAYHNQA